MVRLMRFTRFTIIGDDVKPGTNVYTATDTFHRRAQLFLPDELNFAEYTSIRLLYTKQAGTSADIWRVKYTPPNRASLSPY